MRTITFFLALIGVLPLATTAQTLDLPRSTLILHYRLSIAYNTTTVLVFPAAVRPVDRGDRDILAQKQPGADNVLKLKAARRNFAPTNLHVFTADGAVYPFEITYTDSPATTHDLTRLVSTIRLTGSVRLTNAPLNSAATDSLVAATRDMPSFLSVTDRRDRMTLRLESLGTAADLVWLRFSLSNRSRLEFTPDFLRLYIRDRVRSKRTSVQEREVNPFYLDSLATVPGRDHRTYVMAIPRVTIPASKQLRVELYERNGGRSLTLRIRNHHLFQARRLSFPLYGKSAAQ